MNAGKKGAQLPLAPTYPPRCATYQPKNL